MDIVDILIIAILILYGIKGFKNGVIKEGITFIGGFIVIVIAYFLKNPLSVYMYEHLPFINFKGIFNGVSVLNILVYEAISFLIVASVLMLIYKIVLAATNIIEKILKFTIILELPSKLLGLLVGFIEGLLIVFIALFICVHIPKANEYLSKSKYTNIILTKTPILSEAIDPLYNSVIEIYEVAKNYKDTNDREKVNLQALDIMLKYKVVEVENIELLTKKDKINIKNVESVLNKYKGEIKND